MGTKDEDSVKKMQDRGRKVNVFKDKQNHCNEEMGDVYADI